MYILACDERGSLLRNSRSRTWTYGGLIFSKGNYSRLISNWNFIKNEICGEDQVELKWSHFFTENKDNPILEKQKKQSSLLWALDQIFQERLIETPLTMRICKDNTDDTYYEISKRGNEILDIDTFIASVYAQFALFLRILKGRGEIWMDKLGSRSEELRRQNQWSVLRRNNINKENKRMTLKIREKIKFFDSKEEPVIQIADFISGVIWCASEGDEKILLNTIHNYFPYWWSKISLVTIGKIPAK